MKIDYYSGAGNLFSIFDNRSHQFQPDQLAKLAQIACSKTDNFTIRTEGLIAFNNFDGEKFSVSFFNPDGSTGMMCGNGARSAVSFIKALGLIQTNTTSKIPQEIVIELAGKEYPATISGEMISVSFPKHRKLDLHYEIKINNYKIYGDFVDVGSPHFILNFNQIPNHQNFTFRHYPLEDLAKPIRWNKEKFPEGVNVSIYDVESADIVHLRTFERGVEAETGACGTAAISTALVLYQKGLTNKEIQIIPTSKIPLRVEILIDNSNQIIGFNLIGTAEKIGEALIDF